MSSDKIVIDISNLRKRYEIYAEPRDRLKQLLIPPLHRVTNGMAAAMGISKHREPPHYFHEFWALDDISFRVKAGETLGIIGRNGSGKSTLLQILAGTLAPTSGEVEVLGRIAALLELGSGFNPEFTGRENVFLNGRILGLSKKEIEDRYVQIVEFADIGEFIEQPVKTYSSGMFLRLAFAVQAHIDASIVIIDEALAVGDVFFRQKCYGKLEQLKQSGAAILLVSHSMPDIEQYCERAILLDHGKMRFVGSASEAAKHYYLIHQESKVKDKREKNLSFDGVLGELPEWALARPQPQDFIDLSNKQQVGNGEARLLSLALLNEAGEPCNSFRQGDRAVFWAEFELLDDIGVPIFGTVIKNERGIIVHGKNSWQDDSDVPLQGGIGKKVLCCYEVMLELGPGEYVFDIALSSVLRNQWKNRHEISHEDMSSFYVDVCHLTNAGYFSIGLSIKNGISVLTHHGVANLSGKIKMAVQTIL